jgi:hypothetical protein
MTPKEIEEKTDELKAKFIEENSVGELQAIHLKVFGIASKSKDKQGLATKIARNLVEKGEDVQLEEAPVDAEKAEALASAALKKIEGAYREHERLIEARKEKLADLRQVIGKAKDSIADTMKDAKLDDKGKLNRLESAWSMLVRTEQKRADVNADFAERIKASKQTVKSEFENARQLSLF